MRKIILGMLISMFVSLNAHAQATGCLLPNNRVYTSKGLLGTYIYNVYTGLPANYCSWTPSTGPTCYVCNGALNLAGACLVGTTSGVEGTFNIVLCDLDEHSPLIVVFVGLTGVLFIRRNTKKKMSVESRNLET